jgi:hypothetical protein
MRTRRELYLVVGYMSFHKAEITQTSTEKKTREAKATVAGGTIARIAASASGAPVLSLTGETGNTEVESARMRSSNSTMTSKVVAVGSGGEVEESAEEVFAIEYKIVSRDLAGFGKNIQLSGRAPEYKGGQSLGDHGDDGEEEESDVEDDEEMDDDNYEIRAAQSLVISDETFVGGNDIAIDRVLDEDAGFYFMV